MKNSQLSLITVLIGSFAVIGQANAATIDFPDFSDVSAWQLNGNTTTANNGSQDVLRLTSGLTQSGSGFLSNTISLDNGASFSARFQFQITNPIGLIDAADGVRGADGIVFAVQTQSNTAGGTGQGIGYGGISNSLGIEFDTWDNTLNDGVQDGNNGNHIGINLNGSVDSQVLTPIAQTFNDGSVYTAWVDYNGTTDWLEVRFADTNTRPETASASLNVNLVNILGATDAFVGFTSGTGDAANTHDILNFTFTDDFEPIDVTTPEPSAILGLIGVSLLSVVTRKRK